MPHKLFPDLGIGLGLRAPHYSEIVESPPKVDWLEATSENYMGIDGGHGARPLKILEKVRTDFPVVLHGVSLSIGSTDPLDLKYLGKLKVLCTSIQPDGWILNVFKIFAKKLGLKRHLKSVHQFVFFTLSTLSMSSVISFSSINQGTFPL